MLTPDELKAVRQWLQHHTVPLLVPFSKAWADDISPAMHQSGAIRDLIYHLLQNEEQAAGDLRSAAMDEARVLSEWASGDRRAGGSGWMQ